MNEKDDTILEFLQDTGAAFHKTGLQVNFELRGIDFSYSTIKRRVALLEDAGLIEKVREKGGYYAISNRGEAYLAGDLDASKLEE